MGACLLFSFFLILTIVFLPNWSEPDQLPSVDAERLVGRYAPILHFDANETLFPSDVDVYIANCRLMCWNLGGGVEMETNATAFTMAIHGNNGTSYYLDNKLGSLDDGAIERWYQSQEGSIGYTVYGRFATIGGQHLIQYWMFYGFNNGTLNRHEGDWELFQIVLDAHLNPTDAMFSQHQSGLRVPWAAVDKNDSGVPEVYVTRGSHGMSSLASSIFATGSSTILRPSDYDIVPLTNATTDTPIQSWLAFGGRWGEWGGSYGDLLGTRGPQGPMFRSNGSMWEGMQWGMALPSLGTGAEVSSDTFSAESNLQSVPQARTITFDTHDGAVGGAGP
jgi:hypothetical protein